MKKKVIKKKKNKLNFSNYLNSNDRISFFLVISYRKTNIFITYFFKNARYNKTFLVKKLSFGYTERKTAKVKIFQRNRYKRVFGYIRPRVIALYKYIAALNFHLPHLKKFPLFIQWKIYKFDNTLFLLISKCSLFKFIKEHVFNKLEYYNKDRVRLVFSKQVKRIRIGHVGKIKKYIRIFRTKVKKYLYNPKKFKNRYFQKIYTRFYLKKSHNGCKISKRRYVKKRRAKKALQFQLKNYKALRRTLSNITY